MSPPESTHPTTASSEYSNTTEAQEKDLKSKIMKMIEVLKEPLKEIEEKTKIGGNE